MGRNCVSDDEDFYDDPFSKEFKRRKKEIDNFNSGNMRNLDIISKVVMSNLPLKLKSEILKQLSDSAFMESGKYKSWVNNLMKIPFGKYSNGILTDNITPKEFLKKSEKILDDTIYKQARAKESIMDFCCKLISNPGGKGGVLALQSVPGTGKTVLVRQGLAKILNRPFFSINFGGLTDSNALVGHDYTYMGSKYGRISSILMEAGVMDPVIYLDEIDKIGSGTKSQEVYGVLTHLLDEEQNAQFTDNYFQGIHIDLSRVLFVISFNDISKISNIVADRMKIIKMDNLSKSDKIHVLKNFVLPKIMSDIRSIDIHISDDIFNFIIDHNKEKSIRQVKKIVESIIERVNRLYHSGKITPGFSVTQKIVEDIVEGTTVCEYTSMYS